MEVQTPEQARQILLEARRRAARPRPIEIADPNFPLQHRFVMDRSKRVAGFCTRRAGKSNGLGLRYSRTLQTHPGAFCPYIALTRESAKNIMWDVLQEIDEKFKIGVKFTVANLTATYPGGGRVQLFGADMKNFIKRLKGIKTPGAGIDECQDFGDHLQQLVDDVLTPATVDYTDSWIAMTGTAGPVPVGYFYKVTHERKYGYSVHEWGLHDNPYIMDSRKFVNELRASKGWADDNPTFIREYGGVEGRTRWVLDLDAIVFKYLASRNDYTEIPKQQGPWEHVLGVDIGWHDSDAIAAIGWPKHSDDAYLIEEDIQAGQGITELAQRLEYFIRKYNPVKIVMDTAGLGKKVAEEIRRRFSIPVEAAEKTRMYEFIELLNDAMRLGKFHAKRDSRFAHDSALVKWDRTSVKPKIADGFHSDICPAVLYGYREALHWLAEPAIVKPTTGTPEWVLAQEREMEEQAERRARSSHDSESDFSTDSWPDSSWNEGI